MPTSKDPLESETREQVLIRVGREIQKLDMPGLLLLAKYVELLLRTLEERQRNRHRGPYNV